MVFPMVWPAILHYNTKSHSPLTMTSAVIAQRLTIEVQKVIPTTLHNKILSWDIKYSTQQTQGRI